MKVVVVFSIGIISFFGLIYLLNMIYEEIPEDSPCNFFLLIFRLNY